MRVNDRRHMRHNCIMCLLALVLLLCFCGSIYANSQVFINPGPIKFDIDEEPADSYVYCMGGLALQWKQGVERQDVRFSVSDLWDGVKILPAEHIEAKTPYSAPEYLSLDNEVLFLRADDDGEVVIDFRVPKDVWDTPGDFEGSLITNDLSKAPKIDVKVKIADHVCLTVDPDQVEVHAHGGPGIYGDQEKTAFSFAVTANGNRPWTVTVAGEDLMLPESDSARISKENVWLSLDEKGQGYNTLVVKGKGSGSTTVIVKVQTELQHVAGTYKGSLRLTLSE